MNPKVGDLWRFSRGLSQEDATICIIVEIEKMGKLNTWYTVHWLDDNKAGYPTAGWTHLHFANEGCFRKLS